MPHPTAVGAIRSAAFSVGYDAPSTLKGAEGEDQGRIEPPQPATFLEGRLRDRGDRRGRHRALSAAPGLLSQFNVQSFFQGLRLMHFISLGIIHAQPRHDAQHLRRRDIFGNCFQSPQARQPDQ